MELTKNPQNSSPLKRFEGQAIDKRSEGTQSSRELKISDTNDHKFEKNDHKFAKVWGEKSE